ncbi:hypothetical protein KOW79_010369 [Hemibagrus wyckioides]|uniref:Uncharacterized protein n=1 Tax=Hemibagrus wyckioides TaxID=337641 RepID=A0A9D3NTD6_9TELE|nr:hypothetical protein KOW79_010369 [Hemibagrus wyckioides]
MGRKGHGVSPSGNRTPVFRVTGGDTVHYTNEDNQVFIVPTLESLAHVVVLYSLLLLSQSCLLNKPSHLSLPHSGVPVPDLGRLTGGQVFILDPYKHSVYGSHHGPCHSSQLLQRLTEFSSPNNKVPCCALHKTCTEYMALLCEGKRCFSPSGNRTPVFRVTGGDTVHYTNEELVPEP